MITYVHFVSFAHAGGFGNCTLNLPAPITHDEHIKQLEQVLSTRGFERPVVLNFPVLRTESADA